MASSGMGGALGGERAGAPRAAPGRGAPRRYRGRGRRRGLGRRVLWSGAWGGSLVGSEREPRAPLLAAGPPGGTGAGGAGGAWGGGSFGAGPGGVAWWAWVLALAQLGAAALLLAQGRPPVPAAD